MTSSLLPAPPAPLGKFRLSKFLRQHTFSVERERNHFNAGTQRHASGSSGGNHRGRQGARLN
jgi:hypothetical protein